MSADNPLVAQPDGYGDLLQVARSLSLADTHLDSPPRDLWAGIEALVAAGPRGATDVRATAPTSSPPEPVTSLAGHRLRRPTPRALGAAAASVAAVVGLSAFIQRDHESRVTTLDAISLSNVGLAPEGTASTARARLIAQADGRYALDIEVADLPSAGNGFLELWIIDTSVEGMYSLGPLHGSGRYALPDHVEPADFPIVDVSVEPADGVPEHSGKSVLRGSLTI